MPENYRPVKGDRVRVVLEGEVVSSEEGAGFRLDSHTWVSPKFAKSVVSIEKIEPPVVAFKPGDVVRELATGIVLALSETGYTYLKGALCTGTHFEYRKGYSPDAFNSRYYELVSIS